MEMHLGLNRMLSLALAVVLASGAVLAAGCGGSGGEESPEGSPLGIEMPEGSSGTIVASRDGEIQCAGWGQSDREEGVAADCETVYDIMSMTKQFTAAAIVKLHSQGSIDFEYPISAYLPGVPRDKRHITVEQLLTHSSGLIDSLGGDEEPLTRKQMLDRAWASELQFKPGTGYQYSNLGYSLLAAIIEEVSGSGYEEYLADNLFEPAGMTRTGYVLPDWSDSRVAVEYDANGEPRGTPLERHWAEDGPYWNLRGNGGLLSTARDMYRWNRALAGDRVLGESAKRELFEPRVRETPDDSHYAFGWVVLDSRGNRILWHNGGNGLSYGEIARDPAGDAFVFWVANQARDKGAGWDLEESGESITRAALRPST